MFIPNRLSADSDVAGLRTRLRVTRKFFRLKLTDEETEIQTQCGNFKAEQNPVRTYMMTPGPGMSRSSYPMEKNMHLFINKLNK